MKQDAGERPHLRAVPRPSPEGEETSQKYHTSDDGFITAPEHYPRPRLHIPVEQIVMPEFEDKPTEADLGPKFDYPAAGVSQKPDTQNVVSLDDYRKPSN